MAQREWVKVYHRLAYSGKWMAMSMSERGVWLTALLYAIPLDGTFTDRDHVAVLLKRDGVEDPEAAVDRLVSLRLLDVREDGAVWVHDWEQWQSDWRSWQADNRFATEPKDSRSRQRAKQWGVETERIEFRIVWERDGGVCALCLEPVDEEPGVLDHVVPLSKGGPHTYANVQLAHRACNGKKAASGWSGGGRQGGKEGGQGGAKGGGWEGEEIRVEEIRREGERVVRVHPPDHPPAPVNPWDINDRDPYMVACQRLGFIPQSVEFAGEWDALSRTFGAEVVIDAIGRTKPTRKPWDMKKEAEMLLVSERRSRSRSAQRLAEGIASSPQDPAEIARIMETNRASARSARKGLLMAGTVAPMRPGDDELLDEAKEEADAGRG